MSERMLGGRMSQRKIMCTVTALGLLWASAAKADATHVVARGHTLESIANRYHVSPKAIVDANKLKNPNRLKPGDTLTIPGVKDESGKNAKDGKDGKDGKDSAAKGKAADPKAETKKTKPPTYAMKPKTPGVLHLSRLATSEDASFRATDRRGKTAPQALKTVEKLLRSASGQSQPIEPRLIALLTIVSDHFGGRKIEVISGFRPYVPTQHTAHSNHNIGHAIDFRVTGVPNEVVRDYCRTLRNVGVGYYPNSTFVHLDARSTSAFWIDYSRPGEPPRYNDPNVQADEGTSDVGADVLMIPPPDPADAPGANPAPTEDGDKSDKSRDGAGETAPASSGQSLIEKAAGAASAAVPVLPMKPATSATASP
jgi:uncharacterized protein YcbK (DUF882 family)